MASLLIAAVPLAGQSVTSATVSGTVTDRSGFALRGAVVTLVSTGVGGNREAVTDGSGGFTFALIAVGSYEIRAEAVGYRPVVARPLTLIGGERRSVALTLAAAEPPVVSVDTVALSTASSSWRAGGFLLGRTELEEMPHRFEDVSSAVALVSSFDNSLGSLGLPGSMTLMVADGVPVYRAPHPLVRSEHLSSPLFPRSAVAGIGAYHDAPDIEWSGAAGGYLVLASGSGTRGPGPEVEGAWSGRPLWSSSRLDFSAPSLVSVQGSARATIEISPETSDLFVTAEGFQQEIPIGPRISEAAQPSLMGLDPDLVASLAGPTKETVSRYSALARLDAQPSPTTRTFVRGSVAFNRREFDGPGPIALGGDVGLPEESIDYSVAGGLASVYNSVATFEVRGGVSGSSRTFAPAVEGAPTALLVGTGSSLGVAPGASGESSRTDVVILPIAHFLLGGGNLKVGGSARLTAHTMARNAFEEFLYSDGSALVGARGFAHSVTGADVSYTSSEVGAFTQFTFEPSPGLSLSLGGRFDYESIPGSEARLNAAWLQASGLRNDAYPSVFAQLAAGASFTWDVARDGSTVLFATVSQRHGDLEPNVAFELFAQDDNASATRFLGPGLTWPGGTPAPPGTSSLATVSLLGPDARAPRSSRVSGGMVHQLAPGWNVYLGGAYRRTDFLMRRRNLNLAAAPQALDAAGRNVFGTLSQDGSLVVASGSDGARFSGFHEVWALDPDGWSKYRGGSVGLRYTGSVATLYASYTRSKTTDNWIGAARGALGDQLSPMIPEAQGDWSEATSDYDRPHRAAAAATFGLGAAHLSATYRFSSGPPFTPGYRTGVDANGDGSLRNDVAYVDASQADPLFAAWPCLARQGDRFASRNSCRGPLEHAVDVRVRIGMGQIRGRDASFVIDAFNLVEGKGGVIDRALMLVDPTTGITTSPDGATVTLPLTPNPDFGQVLYPTSRGRMLRLGFRIG